MTTTKITITRALAELKTLDARINTAIDSGTFVALVKGDKKEPVNRTEKSAELLEAAIQADMHRVKSLIDRRNTIKGKIVESNANTKVTIGGVVMSVADAIERKQSIQYEQRLLKVLRTQLANSLVYKQQSDLKIEQSVQQLASTKLGSGADKKESESFMEVLMKQEVAMNKLELVDPLKLSDKIRELGETIDAFLLDVDFSLSESNASNFIEV